MGLNTQKNQIIRILRIFTLTKPYFRAENADLAEENTILRKENERLKVHLAELSQQWTEVTVMDK